MIRSEDTQNLTTTDVLHVAEYTEVAIDMMQRHFLDKRASRVNDELWNSLSFDTVKQKRSYERKSKAHGEILNDLLKQGSLLADTRTGTLSPNDTMAKIITAVRQVPAFREICSNAPSHTTALFSALRTRATEVDRELFQKNSIMEQLNTLMMCLKNTMMMLKAALLTDVSIMSMEYLGTVPITWVWSTFPTTQFPPPFPGPPRLQGTRDPT